MIGGIPDEKAARIVETLRALGLRESIILFGSRAKGNWREGSDIDLALDDADIGTAAHAKDILEERFFPYSFDVLCLARLEDSAVRDHIKRMGKKIA